MHRIDLVNNPVDINSFTESEIMLISSRSLKELKRSGGRKKAVEVSEIIPGDRGKVERGWFAWPL
jgi:hypothetical protein